MRLFPGRISTSYGDFTAVGRISYRPRLVAGDPIDYAYPHIARNQTRLCDPAMRLKDAALFALIGMTLLAVLLAAGFIRDLSALLSGAVAATALLQSGIRCSQV